MKQKKMILKSTNFLYNLFTRIPSLSIMLLTWNLQSSIRIDITLLLISLIWLNSVESSTSKDDLEDKIKILENEIENLKNK